MNINQNNTESVCFQKRVFPSRPLSKPHSNKNSKKNGRTARVLVQHKGRKRCMVLVSINFTVGFRAGKLPSNYYRVFITSGSFFSLWPWWTLQKWEVLKGKSHMLALLSTDCDVDGKCSLIHSCSNQHATMGSAPKIGAGRKNQFNLQWNHGSLVVLKACTWFRAWSFLQNDEQICVIQTVNEFEAKSKQCLIAQRY